MLRLLLPAVVVLALLAGCGSDSDENQSYVSELNRAQTAFARTATQISRAQSTGPSRRDDRRTFVRYQRAIDSVVLDLRRIRAPADVENEHGNLIRALAAFRSDVAEAIEALRASSPDRTRVARAQTTLQRALPALNSRIRAAAAAINTKLGVT